jgi:hypothetical protein
VAGYAEQRFRNQFSEFRATPGSSSAMPVCSPLPVQPVGKVRFDRIMLANGKSMHLRHEEN